MIVNFYKQLTGESIKEATLMRSKNIECVPTIDTHVRYSNQYFKVIKVIFDIDNIEYNVYMKRYGTNR